MTEAKVEPQRPPGFYAAPEGQAFSFYQLRLEQALAVAASNSNLVQPEFLNGEREIVAGIVQLCLQLPDSATARLLLAGVLRDLKRERPQVVAECRDRVRLLQTQHPMAAAFHGIVERAIEAVLGD